MITRVGGITVGHWTDPVGLTGCTVVLCPEGTVGSGEVRGGAPGTRETDLLRPGMLVEEVDAVLLSGGSAFGLAAADGVMRWLEGQGRGFDTTVARVPIVPAAVLFDLGVGDSHARPGPDQGHAACEAAGQDVEEGNVGAGTGCTVAKHAGPQAALKGGLGTAATEDGDLVVGALAAVNALGDIVDDEGEPIAAARAVSGASEPGAGGLAERGLGGDWPGAGGLAERGLGGDWPGAGGLAERGLGGDWPAEQGPPPPEGVPTQPNTTLVVVATNARLTRPRAHLLARAAHDGIDSAIRPAHTMWDGDTVFSLATGQIDGDQRRIEAMAIEAVAEAIRRGVLLATSVPGFPSISEGRPG